jgi:uncharacterized membrane protein YfcA
LDDFLLFVAIGFGAQLIDGALGMAYGVTATSVLLSIGLLPATASASVHAAEVFTTAASGIAHWRFKNIQWPLVRVLVLPGICGGVLGAYLLTRIPPAIVVPGVSIYLFLLGGLILFKAWKRRSPRLQCSRGAISLLGLVGGFLDAIGGGGWGPIVTSTLISRGAAARFAVGSVVLTEFFVTASIAGTFVATIGLELWPIITGLIVGGILAAPMAAFVTRSLPDRWLMALVGVIVMILSARVLFLPQ